MKLTVDDNVAFVSATMRDRLGKQLPFAVARALTRTAQQAIKPAIVEEMRRRFDRPTPYTLNSLYVRPATKTKLEASVGVKDEAAKGVPPEKYLGPEVFGAPRRLKRYERALQAAGILPQGWFTVPGKAAQLDAYGNVSRGQIVQILSYFRAFGEQGYRANMSDKRRAALLKGRPSKGLRGVSYFALSRREGKLPPGIYLRTAYGPQERDRMGHLQHSGAKPVLIFVRQPTYRERLPFNEVAEQVARGRLPAEIMLSAEEALATAR